MEDKKPTNVGDEAEVKERKSKKELIREQELRDVEQLLETPAGRYIVWRLLSECRMFDSMSHLDSHGMAIRSGKRDVGLWLLAEVMQAKPNIFALLQQEGEKRDKEKR